MICVKFDHRAGVYKDKLMQQLDYAVRRLFKHNCKR